MAYGLVGGSVSEKLLFNHASSLLVGVQTIVPLFYQGVIANSEFLIYSAKKIYVLLDGEFSQIVDLSDDTNSLKIYNEANVVSMYIKNGSYAITSTDDNLYIPSNYCPKNIYFSRIINDNLYSYFKFIGYKITIP